MGETNQEVFCEEYYEDDNFEVRLVTFLAVELKPVFIDKYCTRNITKVISDSYGRPVFILYRYGKRICFGLPLKRKNKLDRSVDITQTQFDSDWINCQTPKNIDLEMCLNLSFDELEYKNIGELYFSLFDAIGYRIDRYTLAVEKKLHGKLIYKKTKLDYEYDVYLQSSACKYDSFLSIDDIKEKFVYRMFGSGVSLSNIKHSSKSGKSRYLDKLDYYFKDEHIGMPSEFVNLLAEDDTHYSRDIEEYDVLNEIYIEDCNTEIDTFEDEITSISSNINLAVEEKCILDNSKLDLTTQTNTSEKQDMVQKGTKNNCMRSESMENEIISTIIKTIYDLEQAVNELENWYREKSKNIPLDLPLAERRRYTNNIFDKEELINNGASEVNILKQKLELMIKSLVPQSGNDEKDDDISEDNNPPIDSDNVLSDDSVRSHIYSFSSPYKIIIFGQPIEVSNWTDVLLKVCENMVTLKPEFVRNFDKSEVLKGRSRKYFSYSSSDLTTQAKKLSNDLFVETNFSANDIVELCDEILTQCGFSQNDIEYYFNQRIKLKHEPVNGSIKGTPNKQDSDLSEGTIYFPQKYSSLNIPYSLMKSILEQILLLGTSQTPYIDNGELVDTMLDRIKSESHYEQPHHVIRSVRMFLMDLGVIDLFEGAKKGKYVLKEPESLREMIKDKKIIIDLLKDIH